MKILLLGKDGQLGWELQRSLAPLGELVALSRNPANNALHQGQPLCGDLSNLQGLAETVRSVRPNLIVNAAAYTEIDKAEHNPDLARCINATAVGVLAQEAQTLGAALVHYSTDYVFDGSGEQPRDENAATAPLNVYGKTKLEGEQLVQQHCPKHLIFRTSWVYSAHGNNFAKTMLQLGQERKRLSIVNDQFGAPTSAELLADITAHAVRQLLAGDQACAGLYHLVANGQTSWYDYACFVLDAARRAGLPLQVAPDAIAAIPTSAFPTAANRPHNSRLATQKLQKTFGLTLPHWQCGLQRMLDEVLPILTKRL